MRTLEARAFPALVLALAGLLCLFHLSGRDLWEPNEPIAAQAAREMAARGSWLLPTVNGEIYPDKPPLLFWGIRLASLGDGEITETAARLPSALAGAALVLGVYLLARRSLGPRGALISSATLAVSNLFVEQARYAQHDMLLCLGITLGVLALFRIADGEERRGRWIALAAFALAFGVLAKGPVALGLPALIIVADSLFERRIFRRWGYLILAGLLALIPPAIYYGALAWRHGTELPASFLFRHNLNRFVEGFDHLHPWWFFLGRSPVDLLPASLLLPAAALFRPEDLARRRFHRRLGIWILVPLAFFSFSASKRPVYILPALPPAAMLCGSILDLVARGSPRRAVRRLAVAGEGAALVLLGAAGSVTPFLAVRKAPDLLPEALFLAILTAAGSLFGLSRLLGGKLVAAHVSLLATLAAVWMVAIVRIYPAVNAINSPRSFAETVIREVPPEAPLKTFGLYRFRSGYLFYTGRTMPRLPDRPALEEFLSARERVFAIVPKQDFESLRASAIPVHLLAEGRAGRRRDCLISNRPPSGVSPSQTGSRGKAPASPAPAARSGSGS